MFLVIILIMRLFEILPHTADLRIKVVGNNLIELFVAAVKGMAEILNSRACRSQELELVKTVDLSSADQTTLLIDFLSEVLTVSQTKKVIICSALVKKISEKEITAALFGTKVKIFDEDIKAVTHHEAEIKKNKEGNYETTIVFDI